MPSITTVKVSNLSLSATPNDVQEFFSFSGAIDYIEMKSVNERSQTAFVTFKDSQGAETAVLLSGATIVDQAVEIALDPDYELPSISKPLENKGVGTDGGAADASSSAVQKAEDVVSSMLAKGYILGKDAVAKAKAFDEKHQVISTATAKVAALDQKIGLSEKVSIGATIVNDKVKDVDHKYQVSEKTKSALAAAEQTVSSAGSKVMKNRYILTGAAWVTGAFSRVTKAAGEVSQKTMEKVSEEQGQRRGNAVVAEHQEPKTSTDAATATKDDRSSAPKTSSPKSSSPPKVPSSPKGLVL